MVGGKMKLQRILLLNSVILILILVIAYPSFSQVKKEEIMSFDGYVDSIPKDLKCVVVNERRVFISSGTKIVDERGNILDMSDLRLRLHVVIEGKQKPGGIFAEKITITRMPRLKP
jgi:hypothetical protein